MAEGFRVAAAPVVITASTGTATITIPSATQAGDIIFLFAGFSTGSTTVNAPTGGLGGWTTLYTSSAVSSWGIFYKVAAGTLGSASTDGGTSVTVAVAAGTGKSELHCVAYAGCDGNTPVLVSSISLLGAGGTTTMTTPVVQTTIDGAMTINVVMAKSASFGATWTLPAGYVARSAALWGSGSSVVDGIIFDDNKNNDVNSITSSTNYGGVTATCTSSDANALVGAISLRPATVRVYPTGDAANPGGWTATPSGSLFAAINEDPIVTSQYAASPSVPSSASFTENIGTVPSPGISTGFAVEIEAAYVTASSGSIVVTLANSGTTVATWTVTLTATATSYLLPLTTTQAAAIAGSSAVTIQCSATAS